MPIHSNTLKSMFRWHKISVFSEIGVVQLKTQIIVVRNIEIAHIHMPVITRNIHIKTSRENDIVDITEQTSKAVKESKIKNGIVTVFVAGSTAAITTIEYETGTWKTFQRCYLG